jgi:hypothetical protein
MIAVKYFKGLSENLDLLLSQWFLLLFIPALFPFITVAVYAHSDQGNR